MEVSFKPIAAVTFAALLIYWIYKVVYLYWFRPKKLEKCLREQGFKGNPYRLLSGDQYESGKLISAALSKPIGIDDDVKKRVIPHIVKAIETHGKKSFMWVGRIPRVFVTDPELIREVLTKYHKFHKNHHDHDPITKVIFSGIVSLEGESWLQRRKTISPAFHFEKLKLMLPAFYLACNDMVNKWEANVPDGGSAEVEAWHDIEILTGDVTSRTLFGSNFEEGRRIFELIHELTALAINVIRSVYIPGRRFLPTKTNRRLRALDKEVRGRISVIIDKKMKAIEAGDAAGDDLLGILLENNMNEMQENGNKSSMLSTEDIIGECKIFYFAAQDTTSTLLLWTMVFLSRYPEWQQRARDEVFEVFGNKIPDYDGISRLKIVAMILNEVLRIYPPVAELTKVAHEDTQLGDYFIPVGVQLMMPQMLLHHDPEIWGDDVMKFNPKRFSEGVLKATKSQGSYFPFSLGPRMCIGMNFAFLEAKMAMALVLRRFSFKLSPSYVHAPMTQITLQPQFGAHLILQKL